MCYTVVSLNRLRRLCAAAQNVQALIDDGTIPAAFAKAEVEHDKTLAVAAFDALTENTNQVCEQLKEVSPFLLYRREILTDDERGHGLRRLTLNLWNGAQGLNLSAFFMNADEHHTRIALEMIASYTKLGENDQHFMVLAMEIIDLSLQSEGSPS